MRATVAAVTAFRILFGIDALAAAVVLSFFAWGLADGSVSSSNVLLWLAMLGAPAAVLGGSLALRARGQRRTANLLLSLLAAPALLLGGFFLLLIAVPGRWN